HLPGRGGSWPRRRGWRGCRTGRRSRPTPRSTGRRWSGGLLVDLTAAGLSSATAVSMAGRGAGAQVAGLEDAEGALADVGELVGHHVVGAGVVEDELDEPALGGLQIKRLGGAVLGVVGPEQEGAFLKDGIELGSDDVEGGVLVRAGIEHPDPD